MCHSDNTRNSCIILSRFGASSYRTKAIELIANSENMMGKSFYLIVMKFKGASRRHKEEKQKYS